MSGHIVRQEVSSTLIPAVPSKDEVGEDSRKDGNGCSVGRIAGCS